MSQEPAVTAIARSRGTRRGAAGTALLVLAADQASKSLVMTASPAGDSDGPVSVRLVHNSGASFGIGAGHPLVITLTAAVVLALALVLLARTRSRAVALSLGAVAGGAAGNLADRLLRSPGPGRGAVVDWIHVAGYPPAFNLADVAIRAGAVGALVAMLAADRWKTRRMAAPGRRLPG